MALLPEALSGLGGGGLPLAAGVAAGTSTPEQYCHVDTPFLTQVKTIAVYTIPRIDVQIAGTFQSNPGSALQAIFTLDNAANISTNSTLGRNLTASGGTKDVNLLSGGTLLYEERKNQLDLRFAKILKFRRTRTNVSLDLFNALNVDTVLNESTAYATLWRPSSILQARFFKVSAQFDF